MNSSIYRRNIRAGQRAFSLIEMLVVVAIIGILAGILLSVLPGIHEKKAKRGAQAQLKMIETHILAYYAKYNSYPLDNPNRMAANHNAVHPLYYELIGSTYNQPTATFSTVSESILEADIRSYFNQDGFRNVTLDAGSPDSPKAVNFFTAMNSDQFATLKTTGPDIKLLRFSVKDTESNMLTEKNGDFFNPWRYISTNPTNNQGRFDLWVEFEVGGSRFRVSNWEKEPVTLERPAK